MESEPVRLPVWFAAPSRSHTAGAALVRRITELTEGVRLPDLDLRDSGVQVWLSVDRSSTTHPSGGHVAAASELGFTADGSVPQTLELGVDTTEPASLIPFWQTLLGDVAVDDDGLRDPLRRDPSFRFNAITEHRPLRNRIHVDVAVPARFAIERLETVRAVGGTVAMGAGGYHALVTDADGNEADLLPVVVDGDRLDGVEVDDWRVLFEAAVFYPTADRSLAVELASEAAAAADAGGVPLLIDVRAGGVRIASGKDLWEDPRFPAVARRVQAAAHDLGLRADPTPLRFLQIGLDAVDVAAVREFWRLALRYENDPRPYVTDINHPQRLGPTIFVSQMEASDHPRRAQRNRLHLTLLVASDQLRSRVGTVLAAGGRVLADGAAEHRWTLADPEGNELSVVAVD